MNKLYMQNGSTINFSGGEGATMKSIDYDKIFEDARKAQEVSDRRQSEMESRGVRIESMRNYGGA